MICNSTGRSNVQRKSCCVHPQGNIIHFCQLYQVRISPITYGCYRDMKMLPLGTKGSTAVEAIFPLLPAARWHLFLKDFQKRRKPKNAFSVPISDQTRLVLLLKTKLLPSFLFFHTMLYPFQNNTRPTHSSKQVVQDWSTHCYQFCTISLVCGYQCLWKVLDRFCWLTIRCVVAQLIKVVKWMLIYTENLLILPRQGKFAFYTQPTAPGHSAWL